MRKEYYVVLGLFICAGLLATILNVTKTNLKTDILSPLCDSTGVLNLFKKHTNPKRIVYGYLPYWSLEDAKYLQLDKLSDIAYFGLHINADGTFTKYAEDGTLEPGYNHWVDDPVLKKLINKAKNSGIRFSLTVISQNDDTSDAFLDCTACWATLYENLSQELERYGLRDVNLNFEYSTYTEQTKADQYTNFVDYINKKLDQKYGNSLVTVATFADALVKPRVTDIVGLGNVADLLFVMAYDFHQPTSETAGPVAPIDGIGVLAEYDLTTMLRDYLSTVPPNKIIMGVPYYGYNWVVESEDQNATRVEGSDETGFSQSQTYAKLMETISENDPEIKWNSLAKTPYFTYVSSATGSLRQVYYDNVESLRYKYELIKQANLSGVGIWALGYDEGYVELWNLLYDQFVR